MPVLAKEKFEREKRKRRRPEELEFSELMDVISPGL
jgi:hypothetical protein